MSADLDQTDLDIVAELSADGRRSFREIARKLDISEGKVRIRVSRMQENGYIRIAAVGSPTALGVACNAMVMLRVRPQAIAETAERLADLPHVRFVGVTLGSSDIVIQTLHASFDELYRFVSTEIVEMVPDLLSSETLQIARVLKSEWNWAEWFREGIISAPKAAADSTARPRRDGATPDGPDASG